MASAQQVQDASQLSHEEKAKVGKALEEAKNILENAKASQNLQVAIVAGAIHNNQGEGITNYDKHNYNGDFLANPAKDISAHGSGAFVQQLTNWDLKGPMGGVKYGHYYLKNQAPGGKPRLGWLLAWNKGLNSKASPSITHKVYVEAGSLERIEKMEWAEIEQKLNQSGMVSRYWDNDTGGAAFAEIKDYGLEAALVGANFEIKND